MPNELIEDNENPKKGDHLNPGAGPTGDKQAILVFVGYYLPGFKAGGPTRSIANLVDALGEEFEFKVVTSNRDLGDRLPYPGIQENQWMRVGNADVMYLSSGWRGIIRTIALLRSTDRRTLLYLNSVFSRRSSILAIILRWLRLIDLPSIVVAPRGEFSPGALNLKRRRKTLYLRMSRWLGLYRNILWHASSDLEAADIDRIFRERRLISVAQVIPGHILSDRRKNPSGIVIAEDIAFLPEPSESSKLPKRAGHLRIVFASRISPKKNLVGALRMLEDISGEVAFSIYGPAEDSRYWDECQRVIKALPQNVRVEYRGTIKHEEIVWVFAENDIFLFPTLGENFGHVICEALSAGCPVLISDQTPWRNLADKKAGWDIPLGETERFRTILQQCVDSDEEWLAELSAGAKKYVREHLSMAIVIEANRELFRNATTVP